MQEIGGSGSRRRSGREIGGVKMGCLEEKVVKDGRKRYELLFFKGWGTEEEEEKVSGGKGKREDMRSEMNTYIHTE